jgi:hypothetical protein
MKPYYFKSSQGNVGDDINEWLWASLIPNALDENEDHLMIGVGTLLNHRIPKAKQYTVVSSGYGYGQKPHIDDRWRFIAVRGPITAEAFNLPKDTIMLDGAYLLPTVKPVTLPPIKGNVAYIPHVDSAIEGQWEKVCKLAGIGFIDPRWPFERFIKAVSQCEFVLTEAMHGAIISDAYRVPWVPVVAHPHIDQRKWNDWGGSLELDIRFNRINATYQGCINDKGLTALKNQFKRNTLVRRCFKGRFTPAPKLRSSKQVIEQTAQQLNQLRQSAAPNLSLDTHLNRSRDQLLNAVLALNV